MVLAETLRCLSQLPMLTIITFLVMSNCLGIFIYFTLTKCVLECILGLEPVKL